MPHYHPGDFITTHCSRCQDETGHVILALVGDVIMKVQCRACGSVHKYRDRKPSLTTREEASPCIRRSGEGMLSPSSHGHGFPIPPATHVTGARATREAAALEHDWQRLMATARSGNQLHQYAMQDHFAQGEGISHPVFGAGIVREILPPDKMRVLFRDGLRLLRCSC